MSDQFVVYCLALIAYSRELMLESTALHLRGRTHDAFVMEREALAAQREVVAAQRQLVERTYHVVAATRGRQDPPARSISDQVRDLAG